MDARKTQPGAHLLLYDGVCGFCSRIVRFVLAHDARGRFCFAPLQSATGMTMVGKCGGNPHELTTFYVVADYRGSHPLVFTKSDAVLFVAAELGWPWTLALVLRVVPGVVRDRLYDLVARYRYRILGRYEQCDLPPREVRHRFVG
jgi:predicted DCC family thiol-disulfide oxidoreductase YuxK